MADTHPEGPGATGAGAHFDLSQFYQIFFDEAAENLDQMEHMLLHVDLANANDEQLNAIFRCAHSIKGGAATFGFADIAELTHQMESLLDRVRRRELLLSPELVDVLLDAADLSRSLLARHQDEESAEPPATGDLVRRISDLMTGGHRGPAGNGSGHVDVSGALGVAQSDETSAAQALARPLRRLSLRIGPMSNAETADEVADLLCSMPNVQQLDELPVLQANVRAIVVETALTDDELRDLLAFHVSTEQLGIDVEAIIEPPAAAVMAVMAVAETAESSNATDPLEDEFFGLFSGAPGLPADLQAEADMAAAQAPVALPAGFEHKSSTAAHVEAATIRVGVSKVDQLINLVGELVITQAMLAQNSRDLDPRLHQHLLSGLADLERNTRELQESVMSIRMIPMSVVFNRFPRMLRDLALKCGKNVELVTQGEATELDKSMVEKITDPLTHLVRNSCDHGIETPAERVAAGKPEHGTITLSASHQGGSVMIEVHDDGRGFSREKILRKARERGLPVSDEMSDQDVWALVFEPGFSTADVVTDISGRGVGMDVVKRSIMALGGSVELDSAEGYGTRISVRLPLTLAIMDGMSVAVGDEVYILPLSSVVESFQVTPTSVKTVTQGSTLVQVRDEYMPVVELDKLFEVPRNPHSVARHADIMVVVEVEDSRAALRVDELLGQHQVVVKNLETNYRKIPNVSGATILGDGSVALILDAVAIVRRARGTRSLVQELGELA
ncbi:chemotaxis protein CheA [Diaphorobacter sp. HDW4B]|uniref:chemotaxis protein CheA n=1 Tax=Diaphorobacter sp. HDW4B TaxID=2714925 RepID=UPI00140B49EB|nr:chemotaxis protein CheW [Diaphorobacter sp. HDW4B]QIL71444.1 chemotaxis protein CheA [Diaphorobacter sp. HDW4B]